MKKIHISILFALLATAVEADTPANHPPVDHKAFIQMSDQTPPDIDSLDQAEVVSVVETKGYTYIEISRDDEPVWLAVPTTAVTAGDMVYYKNSPVVKNHESRTLNRTFPSVIFLTQVYVNLKQKN